MATTQPPVSVIDWYRFPVKVSLPRRVFGDGFLGKLNPLSLQIAGILIKGTFSTYHLWVLILLAAAPPLDNNEKNFLNYVLILIGG